MYNNNNNSDPEDNTTSDASEDIYNKIEGLESDDPESNVRLAVRKILAEDSDSLCNNVPCLLQEISNSNIDIETLNSIKKALELK